MASPDLGYALDPRHDLAEEIRRIASQRAKMALASLKGGIDADVIAGQAIALGAEDDWDRAVHESRKRCKEIRAVVRLVRVPLGEDYRRVNETYRDVARMLSPARDAWKQVETLDDLASSQDSLLTPAVAQVARQVLTDRYLGVRTAARDQQTLSRSRTAMAEAARDINRWPLSSGLTAHDLRPGIARVHTRGHRRFQTILEQRSAVDPGATTAEWHDWRKRVKHLWYQLRLVEPAWPDGLAGLIAALDRLSDLIGEDHDLAVLTSVLRDTPAPSSGGASKQVIAVAQTVRLQVRAEALPLACRVYAEPPGHLATRVAGYLHCATG